MWADLRAAFSFLTIVPLGYSEGRQAGWSFTWFPLVGLVIGGLLALTASLSPFAPAMTSVLGQALWVIITGGLHLDGFGDSCDGLLAVVTPERRLEIMKDPRTGSWAVIGLILLLMGKGAALGTLPPLLLMLPPILGRWAMVTAAYVFPYARSSGLGAFFRAGLGRSQVVGAALIALVSVAVVSRDPLVVLMMFGLASAVVMFGGQWAARRLGGGITGDTYGALCEVTELVCLWGLSLWAR